MIIRNYVLYMATGKCTHKYLRYCWPLTGTQLMHQQIIHKNGICCMSRELKNNILNACQLLNLCRFFSVEIRLVFSYFCEIL